MSDEYEYEDEWQFGVKLIDSHHDCNCNVEKIKRMIMKLGSVIVGIHSEYLNKYEKTEIFSDCHPEKVPNHAGKFL